MPAPPPELVRELARSPERLSRAEKALLLAFLAALVLFAWIFLAGGSNGTGYLTVRAGNTALDLIRTYTPHAFAAVMASILTHIVFLPRITVHVSSGPAEPPETHRVWYIPGSLRLVGQEWTWREPGGRTGVVHRRFFTKAGLFGGCSITTEVERHVVGREVYYETARVEVTESAAKNAQIRLLVDRASRSEEMAGGRP